MSENYQDYVFKNNIPIYKFEEMYKNSLSDFLQKFFLEKILNNNQNKRKKFLELYLGKNYYDNRLVNIEIVDKIVEISEEIKRCQKEKID